MDAKTDSSTAPLGRKILKLLRILIIVLVIAPALVLIGIWSALAIYFADSSGQDYRWAFASIFALVFGTSLVCFPKRRWTALCLLAASAAVMYWWLNLAPSHDRDWDPQTAVLPTATIDGDLVTVRDIRNSEYLSAEDVTPRYYHKTFDLRKIRTVDLIFSHWASDEITAHSMLSFGFDAGEYLTVSVEARAERGEEYTGIGGLFRKYELIYVLGDELDLIRSRTNFRGEKVYLYPTKMPPEDARTLFLEIIKRVNEIAAAPEFYNTLTDNCTTSLARSSQAILPPNSLDIRLLLNGYADRMAYENGWIATDDPFDETRKRHHINQYVEGKGDAANFSRLIRPGLSGS